MKPTFATKKTAGASNRFKNDFQSPVAAKPQAKMEKSPSKGSLSIEKIQEKAYDIFLKRNGAAGSPEGDWLEAERILKNA